MIGEYHVYLLLVAERALCNMSMHNVMTSALREHHPISHVNLDQTKVQPRYGIGNIIMDELDVHDFGTILLK